MTQPVADALHHFSVQYKQAWQDKYQTLPMNEELVGLVSPCVEKTRAMRFFGSQFNETKWPIFLTWKMALKLIYMTT